VKKNAEKLKQELSTQPQQYKLEILDLKQEIQRQKDSQERQKADIGSSMRINQLQKVSLEESNKQLSIKNQTLEQQVSTMTRQIGKLSEISEKNQILERKNSELEKSKIEMNVQLKQYNQQLEQKEQVLQQQEKDIQNLLKDSDDLVAKLKEHGVDADFTEGGVVFLENSVKKEELEEELLGGGEATEAQGDNWNSTIDDLLDGM